VQGASGRAIRNGRRLLVPPSLMATTAESVFERMMTRTRFSAEVTLLAPPCTSQRRSVRGIAQTGWELTATPWRAFFEGQVELEMQRP